MGTSLPNQFLYYAQENPQQRIPVTQQIRSPHSRRPSTQRQTLNSKDRRTHRGTFAKVHRSFLSFGALDTLEKGLNEDSPGERHSVTAYNPDAEKLRTLFKRIERGAFIKNEAISVLGLYAKMANT